VLAEGVADLVRNEISIGILSHQQIVNILLEACGLFEIRKHVQATHFSASISRHDAQLALLMNPLAPGISGHPPSSYIGTLSY
jgi:hypothetical protein